MLSKLIKHEWRNVSKMLIVINSFTVVMTIIGCISAYSPLWHSNVENIWLLGISVFVVYYITIIVVSFSSMIYLAVRFYKNIYTDEGYLMHTLPVTPRQLILSKGIVATVWSLITGALIVLSIMSLGACFVLNLSDEFSYVHTVFDLFPYLVEMLEEVFDMQFVSLVIWFIIYSILGTISGISMIYGAVSLGQLFTKHKVMGAFLSYFGIYMAIQTVTSVLMTPITTKIMLTGEPLSMSGFLNPILFASLILSVVIGIALYILTEYIMTKKLNLD